MKSKFDIKITLPSAVTEALAIDEDTPFETYFAKGSINIQSLEDEDLERCAFDEDEPECVDNCEECLDCPHYCWKRGVCTFEE